MVYLYPIDNMLSLLQTFGTLQKEQIIRFFADELPSYKAEYQLGQLCLRRILSYNEKDDTYTFIGAARRTKWFEEKNMRAFWLLVAAGSLNVQEVILTRPPTQFMFISAQGDEAYDVTIVDGLHDALLAQRVRSESLLRGVSDIVTHVAVLREKEDADYLRNCGFDVYATIDPISKAVKYYPVDGN